jgi:arsenate reductase
MKSKARVLFFSTGDATRSRMAAALLRRMTDEVETASTAVSSIAAHGLAEEVMRDIGLNISDQPTESVAQSLREHFAMVVTLSDDSRERSPIWPFTRNLVHWNLADPTVVEGPLEERREAFRRTRDEIHSRASELARHMQAKEQPRVRAAAA